MEFYIQEKISKGCSAVCDIKRIHGYPTIKPYLTAHLHVFYSHNKINKEVGYHVSCSAVQCISTLVRFHSQSVKWTKGFKNGNRLVDCCVTKALSFHVDTKWECFAWRSSRVGKLLVTVYGPNISNQSVCQQDTYSYTSQGQYIYVWIQVFFKENVRYPVWTCMDPISRILETRFSLILVTRW